MVEEGGFDTGFDVAHDAEMFPWNLSNQCESVSNLSLLRLTCG